MNEDVDIAATDLDWSDPPVWNPADSAKGPRLSVAWRAMVRHMLASGEPVFYLDLYEVGKEASDLAEKSVANLLARGVAHGYLVRVESPRLAYGLRSHYRKHLTSPAEAKAPETDPPTAAPVPGLAPRTALSTSEPRVPVPVPVARPDVLHAHQADALPWLLDRPRALLADSVGLGKTITALAYVNALRDGFVLPAGTAVLFLVPSEELVRQVAGEAATWCPWARVGTSHDPAVKKATGSAPAGDIVIATFGTVHSRIDAYAALHPHLVIVDEASVLDSGKEYHGSVLKLTADAPRVLGMTATIFENDPTEMYRILEAIGTPGLWPWEEYAQQFVSWEMAHPLGNGNAYIPGDRPTGWLGGRPHAEVTAHLAVNMLRRTIADAGLRLPVRVGPAEPRFVPLYDAQRKAYDRADKRTDAGRTQAMLKASLYLYDDSPLVYEAVGVILAAAVWEKFVVYAENMAVLDILEKYLTRVGISWTRIDGNKSKPDRAKAVEAFWSPDGPRVLLGSRVLERGLNLQCARRLISIGTTWNPGRETQREGRVCRIGSPHDTYEHLTLLPDTDLARAQVGVQARKRAQGDALSA